jgi:hypothetical protein
MKPALAILSLLLASGHVVPALAQTMDLTTANLEEDAACL